MFRIKILFLLPALLLFTGIFAQLPKYSNDFLNIGAGARAFGMANSVIATSSDVTAGYWNPAGLMSIEMQAEAGLMHSEYFAGIAKYDYGGFAIRIDEQSTAGLSVIRLGVDDIMNTTELIDQEGNLRYDRITYFSEADYGFVFSYARKSNIEGLNFGANTKIIYRKIGDYAKAWGFGFDVAATYTTGKWMFGATGKDITSTFNAWSFTVDDLTEVFEATGNEMPKNSLELTMPRILLGAARSFEFHPDFHLLTEFDADITFDGKRNVPLRTGLFSIDPHLGLEFDYDRLLFVRLGMGNVQTVTEFGGKRGLDFQPSLGVGINWRRIRIDYALTDLADQSVALYSNVFSLCYTFNLP